MTDMVERVAMALASDMEEGFPRFTQQRWDQLSMPAKAAFRTRARVAIEAMRDPSPSMLRAAGAAMSPGKRPTEAYVSDRAKHGIRYRAMIDAALTQA